MHTREKPYDVLTPAPDKPSWYVIREKPYNHGRNKVILTKEKPYHLLCAL